MCWAAKISRAPLTYARHGMCAESDLEFLHILYSVAHAHRRMSVSDVFINVEESLWVSQLWGVNVVRRHIVLVLNCLVIPKRIAFCPQDLLGYFGFSQHQQKPSNLFIFPFQRGLVVGMSFSSSPDIYILQVNVPVACSVHLSGTTAAVFTRGSCGVQTVKPAGLDQVP